MINIAVCDDEPAEILYLTAILQGWAAARSITIRTEGYESAESFLFDYEENKAVDILLLDIQMKGMDGIELSRQLRRNNDSLQIIFITGYSDFMAEGYDVSALHYLMKPVSQDKLYAVLDKAAKRLSLQSKMIYLSIEGQGVRIPADEIVYVESFDHRLEINTLNEKYLVKMPLYELEGKLTKDFLHCHRCYIVNLRYIKKITKAEVVLDSGKALPLSRRLYTGVNRAMIKYLTGEE